MKNIPLTYLTTVQAEEAYIQQDHNADISNGLSESEASESDAFERRVLGLEEEDECPDETSPQPINQKP